MFETRSPFERLRALLADVPPGAPPIDLTVGSPCHPPPPFIADVIAAHAHAFVGYPPIAGTAAFQDAVHDWIDKRYGLGGFLREEGALLPLNGSREGLFLAAITARDLKGKTNPAVLFANPFYQTYPSAAHAIGAEPVPLAAAPGSVLPDFSRVPAALLDRAIAYYIAAPSNPQGLCASEEDWHALFERAKWHDFFVFADECYSELYREGHGPPVGALEAARARPSALSRLLVFNSLSKRSNLAGLRAGFVAGSREAIGAMRDFRNQAGPQVPVPLQEAAAAAWRDEAHVIANRRLYDGKFSDAEIRLSPLFGPVTPQAGFFLWLPVDGDEVEVARTLWETAGVRIVPGSYLALTPQGQENPGRGFVRLALVADANRTREALSRVREVFERGLCRERFATENPGAPA